MDELETQQSLREAARRAGVRSERVLDAVQLVPRAWFVPHDAEQRSGADAPIPIGHGQTTSQPSLVARILEELRIEPGSTVLEIGSGFGYEAALATVLAAPGGLVVTIERDARLAAEARERLERLDVLLRGPWDVEVRAGDGAAGVEEHAPYDAIVVAAACDEVPRALLDQLADGGRLIAPVERGDGEHLLRYERSGEQVEMTADLGLVRYVPLLPGVTGERPRVGRFSGNALHRAFDTRA